MVIGMEKGGILRANHHRCWKVCKFSSSSHTFRPDSPSLSFSCHLPPSSRRQSRRGLSFAFRRHYIFQEGRSHFVAPTSSSRSYISSEGFNSPGPRELQPDGAVARGDKLLIDCGPDQECVIGGIVALGKFDALHIGHRELAIQASKAGTPFLLSFAGIAEVLGLEPRIPIVAKCDRKRVFSSWAPHCGNVVPKEYQVDFSAVRYLSPRQFVEKLSMELGVCGVVAGDNYRFGYRASGNASDLVILCKEYGLQPYIVRPVMDETHLSTNGASIYTGRNEKVSSTTVRHALARGDMEHVTDLLGRKHRLVLSVAKECVSSWNRISLPKTCMLNQPPKDGLFDCCSLLVEGKFVSSCEVIIDSMNIHIESERIDGLSLDNSRNTYFISIEFG